MSKLEALVAILKRHPVFTESRQRVTSFETKGNQELILLSRQELQIMMSAAYDAGKTSQ